LLELGGIDPPVGLKKNLTSKSSLLKSFHDILLVNQRGFFSHGLYALDLILKLSYMSLPKSLLTFKGI
jgi:hypothetical protein